MSGVRDAVGVVLRVDRASALVEAPEADGGCVRTTFGGGLLAATAADGEAAPCTGDVVDWREWPDGRRTVERVHPRRTLLARSDAGRSSRRQLLAANVDTVAVVEGLVPDPDQRRIARLLSLARSSGAQPVVLLTKADLAPDADELAADTAAVSRCPVHPVSTVTGAGLDAVRALLEGGRVVALLGASGVGKSSLLNDLRGADVMRVQSLGAARKGRHTTVTRELHRVGGGSVIDGPGLRSIGLAGTEGLDLTFSDIVELGAGCRFADCAHDSEPGCAVRAAVASGDLAPSRLDTWHQLTTEGHQESLRRT